MRSPEIKRREVITTCFANVFFFSFLQGIWWQTHLIQHLAPVGCDGFGRVKLGTGYIIAFRSTGVVLCNRVLLGKNPIYSYAVEHMREGLAKCCRHISLQPSHYSRMNKYHSIQPKGYLLGWAINICVFPRERFLHPPPPPLPNLVPFGLKVYPTKFCRWLPGYADALPSQDFRE